MYNLSQEQVFICFFILGIIIGLIFDFFKALRKSFKTKYNITFLEDFIFIVISAVLIIFSIIKINGGNIRFFLFIGILLGVLIYSLTISNFYVIILNGIVRICKQIFKIPYMFFKKMFFFIKNTIKIKWRNINEHKKIK